MVAKIFFCLLVASLLYAYTNHNREFTATASAIRQIWSGSCRLSCRQSEHSGFSGLSGLARRQSQDGDTTSDQVKEGQTSINNWAGPSSICVCETCPCAILEQVLRTCSPATNLYSKSIELLSNFYYDLVKALTDLYVDLERVVTCAISCQRPAQSTNLNTEPNINFANTSSSVKDITAKKLGKEILNLKPSAISFRRQSEDEFAKTELHSSTGGHNIAINQHRASLRPESESKESGRVSKSCSKCIESGKVCMNNCPRSNEKEVYKKMDAGPAVVDPRAKNDCVILCIVKALLFALVAVFILYLPLGDPSNYCTNASQSKNKLKPMCCLCDVYLMTVRIASKTSEAVDVMICVFGDLLHEAKLKFYSFLEKIDRDDLCRSVCCSDSTLVFGGRTSHSLKAGEEAVDKVIEDEITHKLGEDLLQSLERKFQVDLERSVDMVLIKIKLLLQNGTQHIQEKLIHIQEALDMMKSNGKEEVESCLTKKQNETSGLAEKALHQMVVCGYALIGQDPGQAVRQVVTLKDMIREGIKPLHEQKNEIYGLLKVCGHDHDSLKKVVKCVISKSPLIKSTMMEITGKLIDGVVDLTKLMAHGAMHEACLIEVIKTIEDEATNLVKEVRKCAFGDALPDVENFIAENNATILDIPRDINKIDNDNKPNDVQDLLRKMLEDSNNTMKEGLIDNLSNLNQSSNSDTNFV